MNTVPEQLDPLDPSAAVQETAFKSAATAAPAASNAAHRAERTRRLKLSIFTSLLVRPLSFVVPLITIPLFLHYLGRSRYGLYETVGALAMWLGLTNLGLSMGLLNRLTECDVANDRYTARLCTSTLTIAMAVMALALLVIFSVVVPFVPWASLLGADDPQARSEATLAVWAACAVTLLGLMASLPAAVYGGYQELHRNNIWEGIARVAMLIASFAVVAWPGFGTVGVLLASIGTPVAIRLINLFDLFAREKPWLRPSLQLFDWNALKWMASQGILLFVLQMSALLLFQTDKLIIAGGLGTDAVTGYAILGRVFLVGYGVYMLFLAPLWPASGEAVRRGDLSWVASSVRRTSIFGCGLMLAVGLALLLARGPMSHVLRRLADGQDVPISVSLVVAMTVTFVTRAWVDSRSTVLNASGVLLPQIPFYTGHAVLNAIVAILVVRRWGVEGVAWTTAITALVTSVWGYPWMLRRYIMSRETIR